MKCGAIMTVELERSDGAVERNWIAKVEIGVMQLVSKGWTQGDTVSKWELTINCSNDL